MTSRFIAALCCTSALGAFSSFGVAYAQQSAQPAASTGQLEEIVVTARKTEEKLQAVPVSITAFSAAKLDQANITTPQGLNGLVPNLVITQGSGYVTSINVAIRSIIQADNNLTSDAPIALYFNGVYNGRQMGGLFDLVDLDRVEVLRGPQGTLFGRNTTGGAVNIYTRAPKREFQIEQRLEYGSDNEFESRTTLDTGDIADTGLRALLAYKHKSRDGIVDNASTSPENGPGSIDSNAFYFQLHGDLTDALSFDYRFDYTNQYGQSLATQVTAATPQALAYFGSSPRNGGSPFVVSTARLDKFNIYNLDPPTHDEILGHSLTIDYDVNDYIHLKNIAAYRSFADDSHSDQTAQGRLIGPVADFTNPAGGFVSLKTVSPFATLCPGNDPQLPLNNCDHQRQYQLSEEFQATGTVGEVKYVAGLYFFDEKVHEADPEFLTFLFNPAAQAATFGPGLAGLFQSNPAVQAAGGNIGLNLTPNDNYFGEAKTFSAYGQTYYRPDFLDDKFEFAFGMRYTFDQKTIQIKKFSGYAPLDFSNPAANGSVIQNGAANFHNIGWLFSGSYQFTDDIMGYAKVTNAYKSGGFAPRSSGAAYQPESNTAYEFGVKSEFLDHRLRINADVFYMKYEKIQINVFASGTGGAASNTINAGEATYKGGELEVSYIPAEGFLIDGGLGYTDPHFQVYLFRDPATNQVINVADQAQFGYSSKLTYNIGLQYEFPPFSVGDLTLRLDYSFQSARKFHPLTITNPFNEIIDTGNYHNLSASATLANIPTSVGNVDVKAFGTNLINEDQRIAGIDFGGLGFGNNGYGRKIAAGVQVTYKFHPEVETAAAPAAYVPPPVVAPATTPKSYLVFFDFNKSDLTSQATAIVDQAAKNAGPAKVTKLEVTGHTDTVGSDAYNMRLSRRRAESVAAQLEKDGIPSSEIEIVAKGKRDLLVPTADGVKEPQNRRVQIVYQGGPTS
jgi:iron complex outermembrane receptor protein